MAAGLLEMEIKLKRAFIARNVGSCDSRFSRMIFVRRKNSVCFMLLLFFFFIQEGEIL